MSKQTEPGSAFAPASGYATAVDAALNAPKYGTHLLGGVHYFAEWHHFDALRDEVRRLRTMLKRARDMLNTPPSAPLEEWPSEPEIDAFVAECDAVLGQSHNEVAERRP